MPGGGGGYEHDPIYSLSIYALRRQIFPIKRLQWGKKDSYAVLGFNNDRLFPEKSCEVLFLPKKRA